MGGKTIRAGDLRTERVKDVVLQMARQHKLLVVGSLIEIAERVSMQAGFLLPMQTVRGHIAAYARGGGNISIANPRHGPLIRPVTQEDVMAWAKEFLTPAQRQEIGCMDDDYTNELTARPLGVG